MATKRGYLLGELDRSQANIEMCVTHLDRIIEAYKDVYPEVAASLLQIALALVELKELLGQFREKM